MSHLPLVFSDDGEAIEFHLIRASALARALSRGPRQALLAVMGPDAYVSPDWYGLGPDQVPTWSYLAAHIRGQAQLRPQTMLRDHLDRLSAAYEERLRPKPPWSTAKMSDETYARLARSITPARLAIESVEGTWKFNQNKPQAARLRAAAAVEASLVGGDPVAAAALMRPEEVPDD